MQSCSIWESKVWNFTRVTFEPDESHHELFRIQVSSYCSILHPPGIEGVSSAGSLQSRASVTVTHRLHTKGKKQVSIQSRNNRIIPSNPLMSRIERSRQNLRANCFLNYGKIYLMETAVRNEEIANIARIKNSTRIASCSKNLLANVCRNFSKRVIETVCRNVKKSAKIARLG